MISPELADVLSTIIARIRGDRPDVPLVVSYDKNERVYNPPMPLLFQWRRRLDNRAVSETALRDYLDHALTAIGVKDGAGRPMRYTFHDFRRLFITDAILHGMPPHIAQLVAGHRDINTTMGYKAVSAAISIYAVATPAVSRSAAARSPSTVFPRVSWSRAARSP